MAHKLLNGVTAVGVSLPLKVGETTTRHTVMVSFEDYGVTAVSALVLKLRGAMRLSNFQKRTRVISNPSLAVGSTAERVANGAFDFMINGISYSKGAVAAGTALTTGYALTTAKYGVILVYIDSTGTITYHYPVTTQAYASAATAMIAGDVTQRVMEDTNPLLCYIGRVLLYNNTGSEWNSQTDDLTTGGADITNAVFIDTVNPFVDLVTYTFDATSLANQRASFEVSDKSYKYIDHYLSTITGDGRVTTYHTGGQV